MLAVGALLALGSLLGANGQRPAAGALMSGGEERSDSAYGQLPLSFAANRGQTDPSVRYQAQGPGFGFWFAKDKITLGLTRKEQGMALELRFIGANPDAVLEGIRRQSGTVNYLTGGKDVTDIPTYGGVRYRDLWPGIDMLLRGSGGKLKYEFRLAAGADPSDIRLAYAGADSLTVSPAGSLLIATPLGKLKDSRPVASQNTSAVSARYTHANGSRSYGFAVGTYNQARPLVIDPGLEYSTFLGGGLSSTYGGLAVDGAGNAFVTGTTQSSTFPTTPGAYDTSFSNSDAFVAKLNPTGSALVYSTFIGGAVPIDPNVGSAEQGTDIAVDAQGNAYIIGTSSSADFPTTPGAYRATPATASGENFIAKLNASGSALVYATFIGAGDPNGTYTRSVAVDTQGNAYATGRTEYTAFPTTPGAAYTTYGGGSYDAYVVKLNSTGTAAVYSTYLGGTDWDAGYEIAADSAGNAYVTGEARGSAFPTTPGAFDTTYSGASQDVFVTKLNSGGSLAYSTFLGPGTGTGIALDGNGAAYVTGNTGGSGYPVTPGAYSTTPIGLGFVTKLNPAGNGLDYSTFLGGSGGLLELPQIALDPARNAYISGMITSNTLPATPNAYDQTWNGSGDAFVQKLDPTGSQLLYATYLGSTGNDRATDVGVFQGRAYLLGKTSSSQFPTTPGAYDTTFSSDPPPTSNLFVSKLDTSLYGFNRPKAATPNAIKLVPAFKQCTSSNGTHGAPLSLPSCNPPAQTSDALTVGTPDANGEAAKSTGVLRLNAVGESPIDLTNGDQSDIQIALTITDVRRKGDLVDYVGEVKTVIPLRITDRNNGPSFVHPATVSDTTFSFVTNCFPNTDATVGSTCSTNTTADAITPGIIKEFKRAVWELGQVKVFDGGSDGDADDANNTLFEVQGLLAP
jgi:hypothetical protein